MIGIVIVAHGGLAREYQRALEHVVGVQPSMRAIAIDSSCDRDDKQSEILRAADGVDSGDGVVIVTDMFGASPCNLSLPACRSADRRILFGMNLPLLIKLVRSRHLEVGDAVARATEAGRKYIDSRIISGD